MAAAPLIAVAALGTGMEVYGQIKNASDRANAAEQEAILKNQQADELISREMVNEDVMRRQGEFEQLQLGGHFSGLDGGNLGSQIAAQGNLNEALVNSRRDAEFKAYMLRAGAEIDTRLANDLVTSSWISGTGTILGAGAQAYSRFGDFGSNKELPKTPRIYGTDGMRVFSSSGGSDTIGASPVGASSQFGTQWWTK